LGESPPAPPKDEYLILLPKSDKKWSHKNAYYKAETNKEVKPLLPALDEEGYRDGLTLY
jgi:hypothetical protein